MYFFCFLSGSFYFLFMWGSILIKRQKHATIQVFTQLFSWSKGLQRNISIYAPSIFTLPLFTTWHVRCQNVGHVNMHLLFNLLVETVHRYTFQIWNRHISTYCKRGIIPVDGVPVIPNTWIVILGVVANYNHLLYPLVSLIYNSVDQFIYCGIVELMGW